MNKLFQSFTDEAKAKFTGIFATKEFASFIEKTKAATDSGTFRVIISTADPDRQGDSVDQNLWDLTNYLNNPVVLWAHDYNSLPIGMATKVEKQTVAGANVLVAEGKFAPMEANPFAQQVRALYDAGIVKATSVGYIPNAMRMDGKSDQGHELLEFSFVPVPANPQALSLSRAKKLGLDLELLKQKGLVVEQKDGEPEDEPEDEPEEGDICALSDGSEGILEADGNGDLQCVPKPKSGKTDKPEKTVTILSKEVREKIQTTIEAMKAGIVALEGLQSAENIQGGEGKDGPSDAGSPKQRSNPPGSPAVPDFKDWQFSREILRAIVTSGSDALERFNKIARANARRK